MKVLIQFGSHKGRQLIYPDQHGARPTLARARDVLFNWIQRYDGKTCLDLFSGTGILGIQAISCGAQQVDFVDKELKHIKLLNDHLAKLKMLDRSDVVTADAFSWIASCTKKYDMIFLDPPFNLGFLDKLLKQTQLMELLNPQGLLYIESESIWAPPNEVEIIKKKSIGDVNIYLVSSR